jgi:uncharacterized spore protein YtfJ
VDLEKLMAKASDALSVGRAFGAPIERDGVLVIPVAWVAGGGGGGGADAGAGVEDQAPADESPRLRLQSGGGGGGGGGFGGVTWPLGVYVVKNGDVRWVPAVDATRIALTAIALLRTMVKIRAIRRARSHD